jgi:hypothetical protein
MPAKHMSSVEQHASVFEHVNQFVGDHAECSDLGEALSYLVALRESSAECSVTVTCVCGATATFPGREDEGRALSVVTRMHDIPTIERRA